MIVIVDVVFSARIGAECGAGKERLPNLERGESMQRERADTGRFAHKSVVENN